MENNYIKYSIYTFDEESGDVSLNKKIIFKLININDTYFFAQEIVTKCIFPIYNNLDVKINESCCDVFFSYVKKVKNAVFYPLIGDNNFKFKINLEDRDINELEKPSFYNVSDYIAKRKKNLSWQEEIRKLEQENEYMCDICYIKNIINNLGNNNCSDLLCYYKDDKNYDNNNDNNNIEKEVCFKYENYIPEIDTEDVEEFGYDLSNQKDLCNLIGREEEIKKIIKTICIRGKSVLLIGESGSGKTSIVEKMALFIKEKSNDWLNDKLIFSLNLSSVLADTEYSGQFEKKMNEIIDFCKKYEGRIILFIDEIHNLYGLGRTKNSSIDAMNILKPFISDGIVTVIGATTKEEYEKYMYNDPAFVRRFDLVNVSLPDNEMNLNILLSYISELENKYNIKFAFNENERKNICNYIIEITDPSNQRVVGDIKINNPTIAKNIIEDAFAETVYNKKDKVSLEEICFSILSCDKLSITFRKAKVEELKESIINEVVGDKNNLKIIKKLNK